MNNKLGYGASCFSDYDDLIILQSDYLIWANNYWRAYEVLSYKPEWRIHSLEESKRGVHNIW